MTSNMTWLKTLPVRGLSLMEFNVWKDSLLKQLLQNADYQLFLPGGLYESWQSLDESQDCRRILELSPTDPAKVKLEMKPEQNEPEKQEYLNQLLMDDLLLGRNNQLNDFLDMLCDLTSNINQDTVKGQATSYVSTMDIVKNKYEFITKPENIFGLSDVNYIGNEDYTSFYTRLRASICDKLKKTGTKLEYLNTTDLLETDEIISPTFEEVIVLWCLEKIDHRLPELTNQLFGDKLVGDVTLKDLQEDIFENIPILLENIEVREESSKDDEVLEDNLERKEVGDEMKEETKHTQNVAAKDVKEEEEIAYGDDIEVSMYSDDEEIQEYRLKKKRKTLVADPSNPLACPECHKEFPNRKKLWDHIRIHKMEPSTCEFCETELRSKKALIDHISKRHKVTFTCPVCSERLVGQAKYEKHLKDTHKETYEEFCQLRSNANEFACRYCQESLPSQQALRAHTLEHKANNEISYTINTRKRGPVPKQTDAEKESEHVCDICGKNVKLKYLKVHKRRHTELTKTNAPGSMDCDSCEVKFQNRKEYLRHMRTHKTIVKTASCDQCGQTFTHPSHLRKHLKIHQIGGEKIKCDTCKRTFFDKKEMSAHVCKHHACEICGQKFLRVRNMEFHKRMHFGELIFSCELCESSFLTKKRLNEHVNYQHKRDKRYKCEICDKRFLMKSGLTQHFVTHTGEKRFECNQCGARFTQKGNLDTHMKLHSDEMPYQCTGCSTRFRQAGDLKRHREIQSCGFTRKDFYTEANQTESMLQILDTESVIG